MKARITRISILPNDCSIFEDMATHIEINDEGGGEFVSISQPRMRDDSDIRIDAVEWPAIRSAINKLIKECEE